MLSLDQSIEFIAEDELVEVTPKNIRLSKIERDRQKRAALRKKEKNTKTKEVPRPTRDQIVSFIEDSPAPVGKREIARAFRLTAGDRVWLKGVLKDLAAEGQVERGRKCRVAKPGTLPEVAAG